MLPGLRIDALPLHSSACDVAWLRPERFSARRRVARLLAVVVLVAGLGLGAAQAPAARADDGIVVTLNSPDRAFSPNGDGQEDQTSVGFGLSAPARTTIAIADAQGHVVRRVESARDRPAADQSFVWDGRADGGQVAADGTYTYTITAIKTSGESAAASGLIGLDTRIPVRIVSPAANATVSGPLSVTLLPAVGLSLNDVLVRAVSCHADFLDAGCYQQGYAIDLDGGMTVSLNAERWFSGANGLDAVADYTDGFGQSHRYAPARLALSVRRAARITGLSPDRSFSPNGDGQEDVVSVGYELWTPAHVGIVVRDAGGHRVRVVESWASHPEQTEQFSWDGRDDAGNGVDDGEYTYTITAQGAIGEPAIVNGRIGVDRRTPVLLTEPAQHAQITGVTHVRVVAADGVTLRHAQVDAGACENAFLNNIYWGNCSNFTSTTESDGSMLLDLDTDSWSSGDNTIGADVTFSDQYGQEHTYSPPQIDVVVPRALQIANLSDDRYFSPDGDGHEDTGEVSYSLTSDAHTTVTIADAGGHIVRTIETGVLRTTYWQLFSWDGRGDDGDIVPDGAYRYTITASPSDGDTSVKIDGRIGVDTRKPATIVEPTAGATLSGMARVRIAPAGGLTLTYAQASVDNCENAYLNNTYWGNCNANASEVQTGGELLLDMDTNSWKSGPNTIRLSVAYNDRFGQSHGFDLGSVPVTAPRGLMIQNLAADQDFSPNGDGHEDAAALSFRLTADATTTITVARADGTVVRTVESEAGRSYGEQSAAWDGRDDGGELVPDGVYTYKITGHVAGGDPVSATGHVGVDKLAPATIVEPAAGDALAGIVHVRVRPRDGITLTGIQLSAAACESPWVGSVYWGNCNAFSNDPLSNGDLAADLDTDTWQAGDNGISATVQYTDRFGQVHTVTVPTVAVTVRAENHAPIATLVVDPTSGSAPLDVTATVGAADPDDNPLTYKLEYGDGESSTGDLPHASLAHTYSAAGSYLVRLTVSDGKLSDTRTTRVEVADTPPATQLAGLRDAVAASEVPRAVRKTLTADLAKVSRALVAGRPAGACAALSDFAADLAAAKGLSVATAAALKARSDQLSASLDCVHQLRIIGVDRVGSFSDSNPAGLAEAFRATAELTGTVRHLSVRLRGAKALPKKLVVGIYADEGSHPGKLLSSATTTAPNQGWTEVAIPAVELQAGMRYWITLLSPAGTATVHFMDGCCGSADHAPSETSRNRRLTALPATWATGTTYRSGLLSGYGRP
jgi:flagellar hook assembly protein FlgD/PKD repeat protein